jgi:hypothetical protein
VPTITEAVGLKALAWDFENHVFASPTRMDFKWENGIAVAVCDRAHKIPGEKCSCGIYVTYLAETAKMYGDNKEIAPIFLVVAGGKQILGNLGFRSAEAKVIAVTYPKDEMGGYGGKMWLAASQAADFYKIPIVKQSVGIIMMDIVNTLNKIDNYETRTDSVSNAKPETLVQLREDLGL